jgi:antitoxin component YwqK of YwqJK toxin-antitoxin module
MLKYYWDNGSVQAISFFYKNKKDGFWREYFENGNLSSESFFTNDIQDSIHTLYYMNGKPATVGKYKLGEKVDVWSYYDTTGKVVRTENFE